MQDLPASVVGIGVDIVDVERFAGVIARTPAFVDRIFTPDESLNSDGRRRTAQSLNELADAGDFVRITVRINGGLNGQADRVALWDNARSALGVA